jgi:apolipoprotein N-acyltransferase
MVIPSSLPARCALAVLSGVTYAMAYPPLGWGWLVVPGVIGLLLALQGQQGTRARAIGFLHGMVVFGVGLSWLFQIFGSMVVVLWCVLAVFTALFAEMQSRAVRRGIGGWKLWVFTALNWCGWEFIRAELFPLKFPWMTAGLALGPNALVPWIGVYGISVFVVLLAAGIAMERWMSAVAVLLALVLSLVGFRGLPESEKEVSTWIKVGGLQLEAVSLTELIKGTRELPPDIQYVVWPEVAVPYDIRENARDWGLVQDLCRERGVALTFGTEVRPGGGEAWRNIALTVDPTGVRGEHTKVHTVHFFDDGTPGSTALPVETGFGKVGTPVCFDCDYEGIVRRMTAAGAEMFIVPIMDAESWTARQHEQHAGLFRMRARENGRWMFVCGSSGVSQVIDPRGRVRSRLSALAQGPLVGRIQAEEKLTVYTRFGWLTPWGVLASAIVCWLGLLLPQRSGRTPILAGITD